MKLRDQLLSGILLILIGITVGIIVMLFRQGDLTFDRAEVRFTEVNRSELPIWSDEELEKIDDRFVFRTVAETVIPTVVYIETVVTTRNRIDNGEDEDHPLWQRFMPPRTQTVGSGVIISQDGYILTNNHVIEDAIRGGISVMLENKRQYDARIVGRDPSTDLAVIKIDATNLSNITVGNSNNLRIGEWVLAVGNPFRLQSTVTAGIVSALSRDVQIINDALRIESFIQTDAAINRGNSGGALVNTSGELIGINTAIATASGNYQGYGFAVPSNLAMKVASDIIEFGEVRRGLLGVNIQSVNERDARRLGLDSIRGVLVMGVSAESAARKGGIIESDIIIEVNGEIVNEANQLQEKVAMFRPGDTVNLTVWRNGQKLDKNVILQELVRPEPEELSFNEQEIIPEDELNGERFEDREGTGIEHRNFEQFGFTIRGLASPEDPEKMEFYIHRILRGTEAHNRGLRTGSKIMEVDGEAITRFRQMERKFDKALREERSIELKIETENGNIGYYHLN